MGRKRFDKDIDPYVKVARDQGWTVTWSSGSHIKFTPPPGSPYPICFVSGTPSDSRGRPNGKALLKRCGVVVDGDRNGKRR